MGTPVTDPALLAALNNDKVPTSGGKEVTDPKLLAVLNSDALPAQQELPPQQGVKPGVAGGTGSSYSPLAEGMHGLGLAANSILKGAGAGAGMLLDAATSPLRDTKGPGLGRDISQLGYSVGKPSDYINAGIDKLIPSQPQNLGEKAAQFVGQMGGGMLAPPIGTRAQPNPEVSQLQQNLQTAGESGIRVTPGEAHAGATARVVEGIGGKGKLALKNQVLNQQAMNGMMAKEFGLPPDTQFTPELFKQLENQAVAKGYTPIEQYDKYIRFGPDYRNALADIGQKFGTANSSFPGASSDAVGDLVHSYQGTGVSTGKDAIAAIRMLRQSAPSAFNSSNPAFNPALGNAKMGVAHAIEDQLSAGLAQNPETAGMVPAFQDARATIAKLKAAQDAFQPASGMWDASALTSKLNDGAPLSGNLKAIAQLGGSFKKSMRVPVQGMPPAVSGTKILGVPTAAIGSLMAGHPVGAAIAGATLAPDAARGLATSSLFQNNMVNGTGSLAKGLKQLPAGAALPALIEYLRQQGGMSPFAPSKQYPPISQQQQ